MTNPLIETALRKYDDLGFDTIPLKPGTKDPSETAWQKRDPARLWRKAPDGANIGIRGGGMASVAIIDCDDKNRPGTFANISHYLAGLGYQIGDYPLIATPSATETIQSRHIYTTFGGILSGDSRNLSIDFGAGEFRYGSGAFVGAPPSSLSDGRGYTLISGDFARLVSLDIHDVIPFLGNKDTSTIQRVRKTIPRRALALLHGKNLSGYKSRSEAEQSLITSLINAGYTFPEVRNLFDNYPCAGKYADLKAKNPANAVKHLEHSYNSAVEWALTHESPTRRKIRAAIEWAQTKPWTGRTGAADRLVLLAHLYIADRAGRLQWAAAVRTLAEMAGIGTATVSRSNTRLCNAHILKIDNRSKNDNGEVQHQGDSARIYTLDKVEHFLSTSFVRKCSTLSTSKHDLFRQPTVTQNGMPGKGGLGKAAGEVWQALQDQPATTIKELADATGRSVKTVKRAIARMAGIVDSTTGECMPMVATDDEGATWYALPSDLDTLALVIGAAGRGREQKRKHDKERRAYSRELSRNKDKPPT